MINYGNKVTKKKKSKTEKNKKVEKSGKTKMQDN